MLLYLYSLICFFLPNVVWQLINRKKMKDKANVLRHMVWTYIFMYYCYLAVQDAAGIGTLWDFAEYGKLRGPINLVPFSTFGSLTYSLNILMFMPLGFLLPLIWKEYRKMWKVALTGLGFSLAIGFLQLFCKRATDIDDLITNTVGTLIGYVIWILFHRLLRKCGEKAISYGKWEPILYMIFGTLGIFFLYNWRWVV